MIYIILILKHIKINTESSSFQDAATKNSLITNSITISSLLCKSCDFFILN